MTSDPRTVRLNEGFPVEASPAFSRRRSKNFIDSVFNLARIYLFFARRYSVSTRLTIIATLLAGKSDLRPTVEAGGFTRRAVACLHELVSTKP